MGANNEFHLSAPLNRCRYLQHLNVTIADRGHGFTNIVGV